MDFRPWMLEAAYGYIRAARILWESRLPTPSIVNTAIGLEILFKSFQAEIAGVPGGIGEKYRTPKGHHLQNLFDGIPSAVRLHFNWQTKRDYFEDAPDLFSKARYPYEQSAITGGTSALIEVAEEMFKDVIDECKAGGCQDPWVARYPDV